ncbi:hypothetical protein ACM749_04840 [Pseudomonas aeruginosa]|uniref:hypothetical protein n=1 Tax=Pseudomonas aeruginosa TaxID=287 RepID=UPI0013C5254C|nr:hypothetical protein [Pseudomonas aeruginosa]
MELIWDFPCVCFQGPGSDFLSIAMGGAGFCILLGRWLIPLDVLVFDVTFTLLLHRLL